MRVLSALAPGLALWAMLALLATLGPVRAAEPIAIVAAENFYGDVAQQIGGPDVAVTSILNNPDQDPHLFEATPRVARTLAAARIVISNGIGYDPWVDRLLAAERRPQRSAIVVARLIGRKPGDNPHIWYDPATMPALARALAADLARIDPAHAADYHRRLARFEQSLRPLQAKIAALRHRLHGMPATATEPVFGYMLAALGMRVRNARFQLAVMNGTEPSAADVAAFVDDLKARRVRLLVYNIQATSRLARHIVKLAEAARIPVVAVRETEPPGTTYRAWVMSNLEAIDRALPSQP